MVANFEYVTDVGEAYQFPDAVDGDYAGNIWAAAAAKDLNSIMVWKNFEDFDPIRVEGQRVQAPALLHVGTMLICLFQVSTEGGWRLALKRYPAVFAIQTNGDNPPPPPPGGTFTGLDGEVQLKGDIIITNIRLS